MKNKFIFSSLFLIPIPLLAHNPDGYAIAIGSSVIGSLIVAIIIYSQTKKNTKLSPFFTVLISLLWVILFLILFTLFGLVLVI